ncbi:MAG TPA: hypothetical protein VIM99_10015 [Blastocatellia bacterium]
MRLNSPSPRRLLRSPVSPASVAENAAAAATGSAKRFGPCGASLFVPVTGGAHVSLPQPR